MAVLNKIACLQGRRDEVPNQALARELVVSHDTDGIKEIAGNLNNPDVDIQNDCIKVLYEAGYIEPSMIADYAADFIRLLKSRNNRMVWGAMLALSTIAGIRVDEIFEKIDEITRAMESGSVITVDNGVKVLAAVAAQNEGYGRRIFPYLLDHLKNCRTKEVAQHAESTFIAVNTGNRTGFMNALKEREPDLSAPQLVRVKKLYKQMQKHG